MFEELLLLKALFTVWLLGHISWVYGFELLWLAWREWVQQLVIIAVQKFFICVHLTGSRFSFSVPNFGHFITLVAPGLSLSFSLVLLAFWGLVSCFVHVIFVTKWCSFVGWLFTDIIFTARDGHVQLLIFHSVVSGYCCLRKPWC